MYKYLEPVLDFVFAALGLLLAWPLMLLVALAVRLDSPGPVWLHNDDPASGGQYSLCLSSAPCAAKLMATMASLCQISRA